MCASHEMEHTSPLVQEIHDVASVPFERIPYVFCAYFTDLEDEVM